MRRLARLVTGAAAILIAAAVVPTVGRADPSPCQPGATGPASGATAGGVNVHVTANDSVIWCPAAVIEAGSDVPDGTNYPIQSPSTSPTLNQVSGAISINKLLTVAGIDPLTVGFTYVPRASGTWATLGAADLSVQPPFEDGLKPIVWVNGSEMWYTRPLRSPSDINAEDNFDVQGGAALDLVVSSGPLLSVTASANPAAARPGQAVAFTASVVSPGSAADPLTFTWTFQDGMTANGASVRHGFAAPGSYGVVVTVAGHGNDSGGVSQPVAVTIGSPPSGARPGKRAGTNPGKHAPGGGPARSRGKHAGASPSRRHAGGSGAKRTTSNQPAHTTASGSRASGAASRRPTTHRPPASAPPSAPPSTPPSTPARPRVATPPLPGHAIHRARRTRSPELAPGTRLVHGRLISELIAVPAVQFASPDRAAAPAGAASAKLAGASTTPLEGIAGGCAVVLLLASGAGAEIRGRRRAVRPART